VVPEAGLDAAAGEPDGEAFDVKVPSIALGHGCSAELTTPDYQVLHLGI